MGPPLYTSVIKPIETPFSSMNKNNGDSLVASYATF
jgi:hypothetical protein